MGVGIGASLTTLTNGTTANAPDVMASLNNLNNGGVSNDGGNISTNGSGIITCPGLVVNGPIQNNPTVVTLNGGTAGTATLYQDFTGNIKRVLVILSGFRTAGANQTIALPVAFIKQCFVRAGNLGSATGFNGFQLLSSGVAQSTGLITTLSSTGGTSTSVSTLFGNSYGECFHPVDTIQFISGSSSTAFGSFELVGQ